jgi:hypothetical protein
MCGATSNVGYGPKADIELSAFTSVSDTENRPRGSAHHR